jgi:stage V sporulation protein S
MSELIRLRVSAQTNPNKLAGSAVKNIQEGKTVEVAAVGAGAINQAVKALAIARSFIASAGKDLFFKVGFIDVMIEEQKKTGINFTLHVS